MVSPKYNEIYWIATTEYGQECFVWNYKDGNWTNNTFSSDLTGIGGYGN